jgi:hypothetical protein
MFRALLEDAPAAICGRLQVIPATDWPGLYRLRFPDGSMSDILNLSRAKDAAPSRAAFGRPPRRGHQRWELAARPLRRPLARF